MNSSTFSDAELEAVAAEAEAGYDIDQLQSFERGPGYQLLSLTPELRAAVLQRAEQDNISIDEVIADALSHYFRDAS